MLTDKVKKRKINFAKDSEEFEVSMKKPRQEQELGVTGVSRSGRVRKKSSLLADFESPDEIDPRYKRKADRMREKEQKLAAEADDSKFEIPQNPTPPKYIRIKDEPPADMSDMVQEEEPYMDEPMPNDSDAESETEMYVPVDADDMDDGDDIDDDDEAALDPIGVEDVDGAGDDDYEGNLVVDTGDDRVKYKTKARITSQAQSVYMMEKSTRKNLVVRDGKVVGKVKAQRKDKGKTRFTAYMLWARQVRQDLVKQNPDMDFVSVSKRLGELWANVPNSEKYNWKRRARRLATKGTTSNIICTSRWKSPPAGKSNLLNKATTFKASLAKPSASKMSSSDTVTSAVKPSTSKASAPKGSTSPRSTVQVFDPVVGPGVYKVIGTQPIDVSAHLKLLGESLGIIGQRLKEHEGQIAVSGSMSVLLDSLLCAVAPLICLTQQVPETDAIPQETLAKTLDNIAYIMPGL